MEELVQVLEHTLPHGNVIVPAFAVGRTQEVLYHLHRLTSEGRLRNLNIYVDSPMAAAATRITMKYLALFDEAARSLEHWRAAGKNLPSLRFTASVEESMALNRIRAGAIVISASGMCNAGRIKHHLRHNLGRRECSVLITGFQAQGTLGRKLVDGAKQVSIFGEEIPVRAAIHTLGGFSAHAGQPALLAWAAGFKRPPRQTFVVHGEESAALAFAERLRSDRGWAVTVPAPGQSVSM
jgi:metallo-beta-lactamase family protein